MMIGKIVEVAHHRNGVGGVNFYAILFNLAGRGGALMLGIVHDEPGYCSVLAVEPLSDQAKGGVQFGMNSWRGDVFEPELREAVKAFEDARAPKEVKP